MTLIDQPGRDRIARDQLEQESDADVARLYDVVGGNPLAIEWVVGQIQSVLIHCRRTAQIAA